MHELDADQRLLLDQLAEAYQQRHGVAVEYLKNVVGEGEEFSNGVGRVVISANGVWFECLDQPMEFSGAAGGASSHRFISDSEATDILIRLKAFAESASPSDTRLCRLLCIYDRAGIVDESGAFVLHFEASDKQGRSPVRSLGTFRTDILPLVFRCRFDASREAAGLQFKQGVIVCLTGLGERNLLVEMPYTGKDVRDLAHPPIGMMPH